MTALLLSNTLLQQKFRQSHRKLGRTVINIIILLPQAIAVITISY